MAEGMASDLLLTNLTDKRKYGKSLLFWWDDDGGVCWALVIIQGGRRSVFCQSGRRQAVLISAPNCT